MFCKKCGKELENGTCFCPNCGTQVGNVDEWKSDFQETIPADVQESEREMQSKGSMETTQAEPVPQLVIQPTEATGTLKRPNVNVPKMKINPNSGLVNFAVVAGVVSLLVGTAFFISRPEGDNSGLKPNGGYENVVGNNNTENGGNNVGNNNIGNSNTNNSDNTGTNENTENSKDETKKEWIVQEESFYKNGVYCGTTSYDKNGNITFTNQINSDYSWEDTTFEYDKQGNEISECYRKYDNTGIMYYEKWVYFTYDKNGNKLTEKSSVTNSGVKECENTFEYTYDDLNRVILEKEVYNEYSNSVLSTEEYHNIISYYEMDNMPEFPEIAHLYGKVTESYKVKDGERVYIGSTTEVEGVDEQGNSIEFGEIVSDENKSPKSRNNGYSVYDNNGNLLEYKHESYYYEISFTPHIYCYTYQYDELGNVVSCHYRSGDEDEQFTDEYDITYEYDSKLNKCVRSIKKGMDYSLYFGEYTVTVDYTYDSKGKLLEEKEVEILPSGQMYETVIRYSYYYN